MTPADLLPFGIFMGVVVLIYCLGVAVVAAADRYFRREPKVTHEQWVSDDDLFAFVPADYRRVHEAARRNPRRIP